jgi:hypothetical protein
MSEASNFLETSLFNHTLRNTAYTSPATIRCCLATSVGTTAELEAGTLTNEVSGNAYARQAITFGAPTDGAGSNSGAVTFPTATPSGWGTIRFSFIADAAAAGNVLIYTQLDADVTINAGNTFQFNVGGWTASFA